MHDYEKLIVDLQKMKSTEYCVIASQKDFKAYKILRDVICAIEELLAAVPHWISVEERLPESGKVVLSYFEHPYWGSVIHTGFFTDDGDFMHDVMKSMKRHKCMPTHWMPLPAPPKGVE